MDQIVASVIERGDLAHLVLFIWASGSSSLLVWALRELVRANARFNDFVSEIAKLNRMMNGAHR